MVSYGGVGGIVYYGIYVFLSQICKGCVGVVMINQWVVIQFLVIVVENVVNVGVDDQGVWIWNGMG